MNRLTLLCLVCFIGSILLEYATAFTLPGKISLGSSTSGVPPASGRIRRRIPRKSALKMMGDDKKGNGDEVEKGFLDKFKSYFVENEDGKGSDAEKAVSYVVDLFTVTAGAAVFTCLLLNLMGKVPCI